MFLESRIFRIWLLTGLTVWAILFYTFNDLAFLLDHWYYPATMVVGAFVAGSTPEGGGAVAFPVLSIFLNIDRVLARDFSLMIQSIGMTSASIFILTRKDIDLRSFKPLLWFIPVAFTGFVAGMLTLQGMNVYIIQALFLSLIATFATFYYFSSHRGEHHYYAPNGNRDLLSTVVLLFLGGMCTSLFGTGADILIYSLLVTRYSMNERTATQMSVILMASLSIMGYAYRGFIDQGLTSYQIQTWLCAFPVVLFMAPLGAYVLARFDKEYMLRAVVVLNLAQLCYFVVNRPSLDKFIWTTLFTVILSLLFYVSLARLARRRTLAAAEAE
jgi:uncharacterized membrane protein YfcA